jgi:lipopolysaccharide transport system permease protein
MQNFSSSPTEILGSILRNQELIANLVRREVLSRYRGSIMGIFWSLINPILMLTIYTFVFSVVFKSRWGGNGSDSNTDFALNLFVGLILFNLFSETISRAPLLMLNNISYVKKVVFPLEVLPIISFGTAFFHALISFSVLFIVFFIANGFVNWTIIFLPLIIFPLVFIILGFSWVLASMGVFVRDIGQTIGILVSLMMFLSPVFFPVSAVPQNFQFLIMLNPLSFIIEQAREVIIVGIIPDLMGLSIYLIVSLLIMIIGFAWFQKTRKGFADVL